ncbi:MAG TPA: M23 family peptidase, partial [Chitinophagaceae bacterium]|nr:M23 family peptidase [Chitinophagaceae bacterium]
SIYSGSPQFFGLKYAAGSYTLAGKENIIKTGLSRVSFAIQAYDRISGSNNQDGIYSAELFADNKPIVSFVMDSIDYTATAYMNAHIDYRLKYNGGAFFQHLSCLPGDMGGVYHTAYGDGTIVLDDTAVHHIRIEVKDAYGNSTSLRFDLQYDERLAKPAPAAGSGTVFVPGQVNILEKPGAEFYFPESNFYDTVYSFYQQRSLAGTYTVTDEHQLNDPSIPVHGSFQVRLRAQKNTIPDEWKNKLVMVRSYRSSHSVRKAAWQDGWVTASFGDFGHFQAFSDLEPPAINELGKGDTIDLSPAKSIVLTPTDNYGIKSFRAELDGKWLRMTNDKGRSWVYIFDEQCPDGLHQLKVRIEDIVGNVTEKTWWFKKYPYTPPPVKKKAPVKKKTTTKKAPVRKK